MNYAITFFAWCFCLFVGSRFVHGSNFDLEEYIWNIIIKDVENIITDDKHICDLFTKYFVNVAEGIGFEDELPEDKYTESGYQIKLRRHAKHPIILKTNANKYRILPDHYFSHVQAGKIEKIIQAINHKKVQGYDCTTTTKV